MHRHHSARTQQQRRVRRGAEESDADAFFNLPRTVPELCLFAYWARRCRDTSQRLFFAPVPAQGRLG